MQSKRFSQKTQQVMTISHPNIMKLAAYEFSEPLTTWINDSIKSSKFSSKLECVEVNPLYNTFGPLLEGYFRPVRVLSCVLNYFIKCIYNDQICKYFTGIIWSYLSAFRKKYGSHHVLLKLLEYWKSALDRVENVCWILMDFNKAFDSLPHRLLLCKLLFKGFQMSRVK